jgi:hypothetical protein
VFSGYDDGYVRVWDLETMIQVSSLKESKEAIRHIYHKDG